MISWLVTLAVGYTLAIMKLIRILSLLAAWALCHVGWAQTPAWVGAWQMSGQPEQILIVTDSYWSLTSFDRTKKEFVRTQGGPFSISAESVKTRIDFDSADPKNVGKYVQGRVKADKERLRWEQNGQVDTWTRIDSAQSPLAGVWRITRRLENGQYGEMPLRARRTLKILSGTRFQWVAINVETGEFSGTGGGTFTFKDGKYTEHIEFFSRDGSRVGASLEFSGAVKGDDWHHQGKSSRGDPLDEVWSRFKPELP